jgi:hypothetical protein
MAKIGIYFASYIVLPDANIGNYLMKLCASILEIE